MFKQWSRRYSPAVDCTAALQPSPLSFPFLLQPCPAPALSRSCAVPLQLCPHSSVIPLQPCPCSSPVPAPALSPFQRYSAPALSRSSAVPVPALSPLQPCPHPALSRSSAVPAPALSPSSAVPPVGARSPRRPQRSARRRLAASPVTAQGARVPSLSRPKSPWPVPKSRTQTTLGQPSVLHR